MNFAIKKRILSQADILILLNAFDAESTPSLSSHIDFVTWSKKLENAIFIQCYYNDEVIGTLAYYVNECVFITHIAVKSAYRRLHVAQKMLDSLLSTSCKDIKLEVRKDNRGAINFYKKNRFDIEEERENTYILKHELINKCDEKYTVCVHCPTYNHVNYIDDCLTGFVMQKTTFPFCVIVVDDASTDGNQSIIQKYADTYPEIIKPILLKENHYSKGIPKRKFYDEYDCQAKYIAMCEGDDYWTDPLKLQKQVDFMEANPEYSICFHKVKRLIQQTGEFTDEIDVIDMPGRSTIVDLVEGNYIHTPSALYRIYPKIIKQHLNMIPCLFGDYTTWLLLANKGDIFKFEDIMAVYRVGNGVFSSTKWNTKHKLELIILFSQLYTLIDNDVAKQKIHEMVICQKRYIMDDLKILSIQLDKIQSTRLYKLIRVLTSPMRFVKSYFKRKNSNIR